MKRKVFLIVRDQKFRKHSRRALREAGAAVLRAKRVQHQPRRLGPLLPGALLIGSLVVMLLRKKR